MKLLMAEHFSDWPTVQIELNNREEFLKMIPCWQVPEAAMCKYNITFDLFQYSNSKWFSEMKGGTVSGRFLHCNRVAHSWSSYWEDKLFTLICYTLARMEAVNKKMKTFFQSCLSGKCVCCRHIYEYACVPPHACVLVSVCTSVHQCVLTFQMYTCMNMLERQGVDVSLPLLWHNQWACSTVSLVWLARTVTPPVCQCSWVMVPNHESQHQLQEKSNAKI